MSVPSFGEPNPDGWRCVAMHDSAYRRGVWFREDANSVTIRAGREGDDACVKIAVGDKVTKQMLFDLIACLEYGAWMQEDEGPDHMGTYAGDTEAAQ